MSKMRNDKKVFEEHVITQEGEVVSSKTVYKAQDEPDFVKLYIDCVFDENIKNQAIKKLKELGIKYN